MPRNGFTFAIVIVFLLEQPRGGYRTLLVVCLCFACLTAASAAQPHDCDVVGIGIKSGIAFGVHECVGMLINDGFHFTACGTNQMAMPLITAQFIKSTLDGQVYLLYNGRINKDVDRVIDCRPTYTSGDGRCQLTLDLVETEHASPGDNNVKDSISLRSATHAMLHQIAVKHVT